MKLPKFIKNLYSNFKINNQIFREAIKTSSNYLTTATNFVNNKGLSSNTGYLMWVDLEHFKTNIFRGSKGNWVLINSYLCSIGKPWNPTIRGTFPLGPKGYSFGEARGFRCYYYSQIKDNYLFHSIPYYLDGTIKDSRLGIMITDGCIRLATAHAKWIYDTVPTGSTVFIS